MTTEIDGKLYLKIAEIVAEVMGVEKDGTNDFHKYKYTSAEAMLRAIRGPLAARKIALLPSVTDVREREVTTAKGNVSTITTVHLSFTFVDGESGETFKCDWAGQGDDPGDKGLGKAYTNAVKTFLREAFLIPQGDDPEADAKADERASQRVRATPNGNGHSPLTADQLADLQTAARGLSGRDIKTALTVRGIAHGATAVTMFSNVPADQVQELCDQLMAVDR